MCGSDEYFVLRTPIFVVMVNLCAVKSKQYQRQDQCSQYYVRDKDGQVYLFYVGGGESAIGVAKVVKE